MADDRDFLAEAYREVSDAVEEPAGGAGALMNVVADLIKRVATLEKQLSDLYVD